jgi:hypothetical protein
MVGADHQKSMPPQPCHEAADAPSQLPQSFPPPRMPVKSEPRSQPPGKIEPRSDHDQSHRARLNDRDFARSIWSVDGQNRPAKISNIRVCACPAREIKQLFPSARTSAVKSFLRSTEELVSEGMKDPCDARAACRGCTNDRVSERN